MTSAHMPYQIPLHVTGRLLDGGHSARGTLGELLGRYEQLSPAAKKRASILLDERITLPTSLGRGQRNLLNLFDGEIDVLLPYYRPQETSPE